MKCFFSIKHALGKIFNKKTFTDKEMEEIIKNQPDGPMKKGPNLETIGIKNFQKVFENLEDGSKRVRHALEHHCYMEVISLRLQYYDFWLRLLWVSKNKKGKIFDDEDTITFGNLLHKKCKTMLDDDLFSDLDQFNKGRIDAIHKYLLGESDYSVMRQVCGDSRGLGDKLRNYVMGKVGIPINSLKDMSA